MNFHNCDKMIIYKKNLENSIRELSYSSHRDLKYHFKIKYTNRKVKFYTKIPEMYCKEYCSQCKEINEKVQKILDLYQEKKKQLDILNGVIE